MNQTVANPEVAAFIMAARRKLKLTLQAFGEKFGRTKANVHGWEKGLYEPAFVLLLAISKESGVPLPGSVIPADVGHEKLMPTTNSPTEMESILLDTFARFETPADKLVALNKMNDLLTETLNRRGARETLQTKRRSA